MSSSARLENGCNDLNSFVKIVDGSKGDRSALIYGTEIYQVAALF